MNMKNVTLVSVILAVCVPLFSQAPSVQTIDGAQRAFELAISEKGAKDAFLEFLSDDSIVFQPEATNGKEFWRSYVDDRPGRLIRRAEFSDNSSNGIIGYTTGNWEWTPKGSTAASQFGQFVTVWVKRQGGRFYAAVDITTATDDDPAGKAKEKRRATIPGDPNKRGWSAADASMNFLRTAMGGARLGGAYQQWAADEITLIREGDPPIFGKKKVVADTQDYQSISYPKRVVLNESADMAYVWNPCEYANSDEGIEKGNCLHIWKLRGKKWWIVLGVLSRVRNVKQPALKQRPKKPTE